jgi:hypothetical protein
MLVLFRTRVTDRKLRLFAVACCRLFWDELPLDVIRATIETNERYADGQATEDELRRARDEAHSAAWSAQYYTRREPHGSDPPAQRQYYRDRLGEPTDETLARLFLVAFLANGNRRLRSDPMPLLRTDPLLMRVGPALFRDLAGNPFHPVSFSPSWRTDTAVSLARQMYDSRDFSAMPILADALQDAGCDSAEVLDHLRDTGAPHVRGCWALDLVLRKE